MSYISNSNCKVCSSELTVDDINFYDDICFNCCSKHHAKFDLAHGGVVRVNYKRVAINKRLKNYIIERDGGCLNCGSQDDLTIDHIQAVSMGGDNHHSNLQCLCRKCNSIKSNYPHDYREVIE